MEVTQMVKGKELTKLGEVATTIGEKEYPLVDANKQIDNLLIGQAVLIEDIGGSFCSAYLVRRKSKRVFETVALWEADTPQGKVLTNGNGGGEGLVYTSATITEQAQKSYWLLMKECHAKEIKEYYSDKYPQEFVKWLHASKPHQIYDNKTNSVMEREYNRLQRYATLEDMTFMELWNYSVCKEFGLLADRYVGEEPKWLKETVETRYKQNL